MFFRNGVPFGNDLKISESFSVRRPWWSDRNDVICRPWFWSGEVSSVISSLLWFAMILCGDMHRQRLDAVGASLCGWFERPGTRCEVHRMEHRCKSIDFYMLLYQYCKYSVLSGYFYIHSLCDKVRGFFVIVSKCNLPNHRNSSSIVPTFVPPIGMSSGPRR